MRLPLLKQKDVPIILLALVWSLLLLLTGCATQEPAPVTTVPGEKPVAVATPPPVQAEAKLREVSTAQAAEISSTPAPRVVVMRPHGFAWDPRPPGENVISYKIYRMKGATPKFVTTVTTTDYHPAKRGTYYVTAVNGGGESLPSSTITL